jgi:tetratricopeptide (TPR) repeat protein
VTVSSGTYRVLAFASAGLLLLGLTAGLYQALSSTHRLPRLPIMPKRVVLDMIAEGSREQALAELEATLRLDPGRLDLVALLARTLSELGRHEQAALQYRRALELRPGHAGLRMLLLRELTALGRYREAVSEYRELARQLPGDARVRSAMGSALERAGDADAALLEYQIAATLQPQLVQAQFNLGRLHLARGEVGRAVAALKKVVEQRPQVADAHALLARAYRAAGRGKEAEARYRRALEIEPWRADLRRDLALLLVADGQRAEALEALEALVAVGSRDPEVQNALAWLLSTHPDTARRAPQRAVRLAEQAVAQGPETHRLDTLAVAYAAAGRLEDAVGTARRALASAQAAGETELAAEIRARLQAFERGAPRHAVSAP